jgi:hypothetical protein
MKAKITIDKDTVKVNPTNQERKIRVTAQAHTIDATAQQYADA